MTTVNKSLDGSVYVLYSKQVTNPWNETFYIYQNLLTGPFWSKTANGADQSEGVKNAPRTRSPKQAKPAKKKLTPHPYSCVITRINYSPWEVVYRQNNFDCTLMLPDVTESGHIPIPAEWDYAVLAKLRRKAYGSGFNPGVFAAEMPEACRMIGDSALRLRRGLLCAALADWRGVIKNLKTPTGVSASAWDNRVREATIGYNEGRKTLSGLWLEIQYGWKPLVSDLENAAKYVAEALNSPVNRNSVRAKKSFESTSEFFPAYSKACLTQRTTKTTIGYIIESLRQSPVWEPSLASVASVAWERLPYSFVCDWVAPISSYLEALRTASDLQGTVIKTVFQESTWTVPRAGPSTSCRPLGDVQPKYQLVTLTRTVTSEISPPLPVDESLADTFSSTTRALNALALLQNLTFKEGDRFGLSKLLQATPLPGRR